MSSSPRDGSPGTPTGPPAAASLGPEPTTPISRGLQVGDYLIDEKIGAGGMGTVYRAVHPVIGKRVAIKILSSMLAHNPNAVRRFIQEARTVNAIRHPNLVDVFSFGQLTDGRYYYVMEYLEGQSLGAVLRQRGRLRPDEALPVFLDVLCALEAAHAKGVVHRDLKPDNVFLVSDEDGRSTGAKLLDFGLAKLTERDHSDGPPLTAAGIAVGTPHYMAPEQCLARAVDARADLYALGVMLYEALTGTLPFTGRSTVEIWEAHVRRPPVRPSAVVPGAIDAELDDVIMRLLAKTPGQRFASAGEVLKVLGAHASRMKAAPVVLSSPRFTGSAWAVAQALSSAIDTQDVVPLDAAGEPLRPTPAPPVPSTAARVRATQTLRDMLHVELDLEMDEPASGEANPAQVSALDIRLTAPVQIPAASPPSRGLRQGKRSARLTLAELQPFRGVGSLRTAAIVAAVLAAAAIAYLTLR